MLDVVTEQRVATQHDRLWDDTCLPHMPSGSRWFVVSTYSQAERRADENLRRQGYPTYLPLVTVQRRDRVLRSMLHKVEVPLFPAYLFVSFSLADPWRPILNTYGVFSLLRRPDGRPEPIASGVVEQLRQTEATRRTLPGSTLRPGDACKITDGAFAGHDAVALNIGRTKCTVALMAFGAIRQTSVPTSSLRAR